MARRALKVCKIDGCPELTTQSLCPMHEAHAARERDKKRVRDRTRFNSSWEIRRTRWLRAHPWCVVCGFAANTVDHIVSLSQGGKDDQTNYQSMCVSCHSKKTASEDGGFGNPIKS